MHYLPLSDSLFSLAVPFLIYPARGMCNNNKKNPQPASSFSHAFFLKIIVVHLTATIRVCIIYNIMYIPCTVQPLWAPEPKKTSDDIGPLAAAGHHVTFARRCLPTVRPRSACIIFKNHDRVTR